MAQHKLGFITASTVGPLLTGKGDDLLIGGVSYAKKIALERMGIVNEELNFKGNDATEWGLMYESEAIKEYEKLYFVSVTDFQKEIVNGWLSCSPDGYIGNDELIEVKCPFSPLVHLENLCFNGLKKYYHQVQFQLMLSKRKRCNLISYDCRFPDKYKLRREVICASTDWQEKCKNRIDQAEIIIKDIFYKLDYNLL